MIFFEIFVLWFLVLCNVEVIKSRSLKKLDDSLISDGDETYDEMEAKLRSAEQASVDRKFLKRVKKSGTEGLIGKAPTEGLIQKAPNHFVNSLFSLEPTLTAEAEEDGQSILEDIKVIRDGGSVLSGGKTWEQMRYGKLLKEAEKDKNVERLFFLAVAIAFDDETSPDKVDLKPEDLLKYRLCGAIHCGVSYLEEVFPMIKKALAETVFSKFEEATNSSNKANLDEVATIFKRKLELPEEVVKPLSKS
eukprot:g3069.t1